MRAHHEKIAIRLFQSVVNNPSNNILVFFYQKRAASQQIIWGDRRFSCRPTQNQNKGIRGHFYQQEQLCRYIFMTCSLLVHVTYMYYILAYYIFRFVKLCNSVYYAKWLNETQPIFLYLSLSIWVKYNLRFIFLIICLFHPCVWEWNLEM